MSPLAAAAPLVGGRRRLAIAASIPLAALSALALTAYPGSLWQGALFCVVSGGLVPLAIVGGHSPFRLFAAAFLALGFWAKFVAHFAIGAELVEPRGTFAGTPAAWDTALGFATAGLAGAWVAFALTWRLRFDQRETATAAPRARGAGRRVGLALLAISALPAIAVFAVNHHYAILRIGFVPRLDLHPYVYVAIAFSVTWGILLWALAVGWWLIERGDLPPKALAHIAILEGAAATLSIGSRAQMLLHVAAGGFALWHGVRWRGWHMPRRAWIEVAAVFVPAFAATLLLVSIDRALTFPPKRPVVPATATPPPTIEARPPAAVEARRPPVTPAPVPPPADADSEATVALPPGIADQATLRKVNRYHRLRNIPLQVRRLFVLRWVGLEGVLTVAASEPVLGRPLFQRALVEDPAAGVDALYQRMARTEYQRSDRFVFLTIPGPVAFAAFTGSVAACFALVFALMVAGVAIEHALGRVTGNPAVVAVTGVALAYLVAQLNFPRTLWFFTLELIAATLALAAIGWWLRQPTPPGPRARGRAASWR